MLLSEVGLLSFDPVVPLLLMPLILHTIATTAGSVCLLLLMPIILHTIATTAGSVCLLLL
jgi:hypothetical protein